jgi:hypothetical protein
LFAADTTIGRPLIFFPFIALMAAKASYTQLFEPICYATLLFHPFSYLSLFVFEKTVAPWLTLLGTM